MYRLGVLFTAIALSTTAVFGATLGTVGDSVGSLYTTANSFNGPNTQTSFAGMVVTATFSGGVINPTCTFDATAACTSAGNFSITLATDPGTGPWVLTDLRSTTGNLTGLSINGLSATTPNLFNPHDTTGGPLSHTNDQTFALFAGTGGNGTWTGTVNATYVDAVHIAGAGNLPGDLTPAGIQWNAFGTLNLSFTGAAFTNGLTLRFLADTDVANGAVTLDTPEPASMGMMAAGLLALGAVYAKSRSQRANK